MGIKFEVKLYKDRAGPPSPSLDPAALSTSPPPTPVVRYTYEGPDDDDDDWPEDDGTDLDAVQEDEDELPDDEKFYIPLFMSGQKKNLPHDIVRHDSVPLNKNEYFSLWKNWNQLLAGKRTYLRPLRDRRVLSASGVFLRPLARPWTLEFQEPLLDLVQDYPDNDIVQEMIKILCQRYVDLRRTRGDGSCFYRAFFFSYLENLGQMQDSQAEVTRLMEHVAVSRENFCRLKWDKAYFLNSEEYFSSVASYGCCSAQAFTTKIVDIRSSRHDILLRCLFVAPLRVLYAELNHLVNSVANGLSSDELYKRSRQEIMPLRIISLLRLLAETEIRTGIDDYKPFIPGKMNVNQYCWKEVRPLDVKASALAVRALTYALGIPVRLETLGQGLTAGGLQVKCLDFFPRSESGKGAFHIVQSYWSSATTPEPLELGSGNLLSSDGTPLLTLLCRPDNCDILYRK